MKISSLKNILKTLNDNKIRYLIVGGIAVNIHGYQRMTHDLVYWSSPTGHFF